MLIHTKLKRLFTAVAVRGGKLVSQKALTKAMAQKAPPPHKLTEAAVSQWFGYAKDNDPLDQPEDRLGHFIASFQDAGIPVERHWLDAPLDEFDRLLLKSTGIDARPALSWADAVWRFSRVYDGIALRRPVRPAGLRLQEEDAPSPPPLNRFFAGERVYLGLVLPDDFLDGEGEVFATVVHEKWHETRCLFPPEGTNCGPIAGDGLRLPPTRERHYLVKGPAGVQRVHALVSRFHPSASVHTGLADLDLHLGLDGLASELAQRPADSWRLLSLAYQVAEPPVPMG
jgi:hypothetical protein